MAHATKSTWQAAIDAMVVHVALLDAEGRIIGVNEAWSRFAAENGGDPAAVGAGVSVLEVLQGLTEDECPAGCLFRKGIEAVLDGTIECHEGEYPCHSPTRQRWFRGRVARCMDGQAAAIYTHETVTERKLAEDALRASEDKYRSIVDNLGLGVALVSPGRSILDRNRWLDAWLSANGLQDADLAAGLGADRGDGGEEPGGPLDAMISLTGRQGPRSLRVIQTPITDDGARARARVAIFEDRTETLRREELHARSQNLALVGRLASGLAHEINNPLMGILNYNELILDATRNDPTVAEFAGIVKKEAERIGRLVRGLTLCTSQTRQVRTDEALARLVAGAVETVSHTFRSRRLRLDVPAIDPSVVVRCAPHELHRALVGVLTFAAGALSRPDPARAADAGVTIAWREHLVAPDPDEGASGEAAAPAAGECHRIRLTIRLAGANVSAADLDGLFDPLFAARPGDAGFDFGLVHRTILEHGGELFVDETSGAAVAFHLDLQAGQTGGSGTGDDRTPDYQL